MIHRRFGAVLAALAAGVLGVATLGVAGPADAAQTLNQLAQAQGRYFGSAANEGHFSDSSYSSILGSQFGAVTPENSMKWDTVEPSQGQFNFGPGDQVVSFAQQHDQIVRGHNLVWHSQLPSWVSSLPTSQVKAAMDNHITQEVSHYKGEIYAWDVVNEPFNDDGSYRSDVFSQAMGNEGYIAEALRTAHAADPNAKLYLNDYNIEGSGAKADAMYQLASDLKAQGVPLDGIGFETHLAIQYGFPSGMEANLQRFANLGLDVAITELDVRMTLPDDSTKDATQSSYYSQVVGACLAVSRCVGITVWGFTDKYSWVPDTFSGQGAACLWDENYQTKPDYDAVVAALGGSGGGDTTAPSAPTNLTVTGTTSSSASLSWSASTDNVGVTGYTVYRDGSQVGAATATSYTDTGLSAGTAYTYTVRARDAAGNVSAASSSVTATTGTGGGGTGGCSAAYRVDNDWGSGFTATVTVTNSGSAAIGSWQVTWSWAGNQQVTNSWNASLAQSGTSVTARNAGYNGSVAAGQSTSFGFQASYTGTNGAPTLACTAG
jgi:endo-1,4-beta-xylanase